MWSEKNDFSCLIMGIAFSTLFVQSIEAQNVVSVKYNFPRNGDCLNRQLVDSQYVHQKGRDVVWHLDGILQDEEESLCYHVDDTKLIKVVNGTSYNYELSGDSLFLVGFQNRTTQMEYVCPVLFMHYPLCYGDSVSACFMGRGLYCDKLYVGVWGRSYTVCDGYGRLEYDGEVFDHVMRVHHHREYWRKSQPVPFSDSLFTTSHLLSIEKTLSEVPVSEDVFLWYMSGCRYPILETDIVGASDRNFDDRFMKSYLFLPTAQRYDLRADIINEELYDKLQLEQRISEAKDVDNVSTHKDSLISVSARLSADGKSIILSYTQHDFGSLAVHVYGATGSLLGRKTCPQRSEGEYTETIPLVEAVKLGYALIHITFGENEFDIKLYKD